MNTKPQLRFPHAVVFAVVIQALLVVSAKAQTVAVDRVLLEQLQSVIEQQQEQLKKQSEQLDTQMETIQALKSRVDQLEEKSSETETIATQAQSTAEQAIDTAQNSAGKGASDNVVTSGSEKVKLAVSGQINRAVNVADDGNKTKSYFVDNNVSNTRVRFVGTGKIDEDTTLGTTVEIALSSNNSFDVSQDDENPSDFIDVRKAEAFARNDSYGQLALGKGQAAADDTAEYDLSLVGGPIMYSGVSDIVGGLQFTSDGALTGIVVSDAFFNLDGKRQDRIRYDSPLFGPGLQFSGSAGSSDSYDLPASTSGRSPPLAPPRCGLSTTATSTIASSARSRHCTIRAGSASPFPAAQRRAMMTATTPTISMASSPGIRQSSALARPGSAPISPIANISRATTMKAPPTASPPFS
jgi:hypothetical protein